MSTTHHREAPPLTPSRDLRHPVRAPESGAPAVGGTRQTSSVTVAMRLLHRTAGSAPGFMSADERAYLEHRKGGAE